jgi:phosphomannomutase
MLSGALDTAAETVVREGADFGAVFDADEDRVFFIDNEGRPVVPDRAAALLASSFTGPVLVDVRSGYAIREWLAAENRQCIESRVGHFFIKQRMRELDIAFGAEASGHYYFRSFFYADSGMFAFVTMANRIAELRESGKTLSSWIANFPRLYRITETNFTVSDKQDTIERISNTFKKEAVRISNLDGVRMEFSSFDGRGAEWWMSMRESNTENLLRLNLEAKDETVMNAAFAKIKQLIETT